MISQHAIFNLSDIFITTWEPDRVEVIWASSLVKWTSAWGTEIWLGHYESFHVKKHTEINSWHFAGLLIETLRQFEPVEFLVGATAYFAYATCCCVCTKNNFKWLTEITAPLPPMQHHKVSCQEGASCPHWSRLLHLEMDSFLRQSQNRAVTALLLLLSPIIPTTGSIVCLSQCT